MIGEPHPFDPHIPGPGGVTGFNTIQPFHPSEPTVELLEPYKTLLEDAAAYLSDVLTGKALVEPARLKAALSVIQTIATAPLPTIAYKD